MAEHDGPTGATTRENVGRWPTGVLTRVGLIIASVRKSPPPRRLDESLKLHPKSVGTPGGRGYLRRPLRSARSAHCQPHGHCLMNRRVCATNAWPHSRDMGGLLGATYLDICWTSRPHENRYPESAHAMYGRTFWDATLRIAHCSARQACVAAAKPAPPMDAATHPSPTARTATPRCEFGWIGACSAPAVMLEWSPTTSLCPRNVAHLRPQRRSNG